MKYAVYETKYDVADIAILMTYLNITPIYKVHKFIKIKYLVLVGT